MALADEYRDQLKWRCWDIVLATLPLLAGSTVFDLGCGIGDQAALLAARGARVVGLDTNGDLLAVARAREIRDVKFERRDLRQDLSDLGQADGLWCSYAAAYFPDFAALLGSWLSRLKPGGWLAVTEIDDLFGHLPLSTDLRDLLDRFADEALVAGRYDFRMGRKLPSHIAAAGLQGARVISVPDAELSFSGPAQSEVLTAWRRRFDRLTGLRDFCGSEFERLRHEFLAALARDDHQSTARVYSVFATRPTG